jgi:hypothetical protein
MSITLSPKQKLELYRTFQIDPSAGFLYALNLLSNDMESRLKSAMEKIKSENTVEMALKVKEIAIELKKDLPDFDKIIDSIKGVDGEDAKAEDVASILMASPEFIAMIKGEKGDTPTAEKILELIKSQIPAPIKGDRGIQGIPGAEPSDARLISIITPLIPLVENGETPTKEEVKAVCLEIMKEMMPEQMSAASLIQEINQLPIDPKNQIDWSRIKGVPQSVRGKIKKHGGGHGGMGTWKHEVFDISSATTTVTLANEVAADSTAILVRYQGQLLDHGVHYSLKVKTITLLFTPEDSTKLSATYVIA